MHAACDIAFDHCTQLYAAQTQHLTTIKKHKNKLFLSIEPPDSSSLMILPSEKNKGLPSTASGERRKFLAPPQPPLTHLEYQAESSALPAFPTPVDNAQPPSYSDSFATSAITPHFAPTSFTTEAVMAVLTTPGGPGSFTRVPSRDVMYPSFQPMFLVASGKTLDKGFPYASPPSKSNPHPFLSHDVNEGDWIRYVYFNTRVLIVVIDWRNVRFLEEAHMAACLTDKQIRNSHLPIVCLVPGVGELQ